MAGERNNIIVIVGKPRSGKSSLARHLLQQYVRRRQVIAAVDPFGEYPIGARVRYDGQAAARGIAWDRLLRDHPTIAIETGGLVEREIPPLLDSLCDAIWKIGHGLLVVDEAWQFWPQHGGSEGLERLARGGRHRWCDLLLVTQRPADLAVAALSLASVLVSFQLTEENDLRKMAGYLSAREIETLVGLSIGQFIAKNMRSGQIALGRIPERGYQDA